jgi:S1-C subfamily serine protease
VARTYPFAYPGVEVETDDFLLSLDGKPLESAADFNARLALLKEGDRVRLSLLRQGRSLEVSLPARSMPERLTAAMAWELLGLKVQRGDGFLEVASVRRGSPAEAAGLRPGDALLAVQDKKVRTVEEFLGEARAALGATGLPISVGRGPWTYYVTLDLLE